MEHRLKPIRLRRPVLIILLVAVIFQISVHRKIVFIFQNTSSYASVLEYFPENIILLMIASIQAFIVLGSLLEVLLGGFVLYFFSLLMQTRLKAVSYVYLYAVASLILCLRTLINAVINFSTQASAEVYSMNHLNLVFRFLDPFVLLSAALFYSQASQLLDLSKNKRLTLSLIYLIVQYVKISMGFIIDNSYLTL